MSRLSIGMAILSVATVSLSAETYRVRVTRIDKDLYRDDSSKVIIETRYCYEYAYGDEAVLRYESYAVDNKLVFISSGTSCDVKSLR